MTTRDWHVRRAGPLQGRISVPGDKSISHRALLLGAMASGASRVQGFLPSADCLATLGVMRALGVEVEARSPSELVISGRGLHGLQEPEDVLDCVRSGTTMRLLCGILAGQTFLSILSGDRQLRRRPMARITEPLRLTGASIQGRDLGRLPPLVLQGGKVHGIDYHLPVASAQVKSALLLAGLYADGPTVLHVPGPARDHTERLLVAMGADLCATGHDVTIDPGNRLEPVDVTVPGDISSAAFLLVAGALVPGSEIVIEGVGVNRTRTGLLEMLQMMGAGVELQSQRTLSGEPIADLVVRTEELSGIQVGGELVVRAIDEFPVLAVAASQARGETVVRDAAELRVKETDRIATTVEALRLLGAQIEARPDGFVVQGPTPLRGATVCSHGDHRLAMALTVAGLLAEGETQIQDVSCVADSFPGFAEMLVKLGARFS